VITGISAVSALFISLITLGGFVNAAFELEDPLTTWLGGIELGDAGLVLVCLFLIAWAVSGWRKFSQRM
jgi:high-affinity nickel-transport protein